jgi:iron complex outermembrane receptor protein
MRYAVAAEAAETDSPDPAAADTRLEEIIVTANRRRESLQTLPGAVNALSGETLQTTGTSTVLDLTKTVPALHADSGFGEIDPRFTLRGIGSNDSSPYASPVVAVAVDDVFINNPYAQNFQLFDIQQLEVLRGPQGTLWGKNTTAGVVSVTSRTPSQDTSGYARFEVGDYGRRISEAAIGGALVPGTLSGRISMQNNRYDGYYTNLQTHSHMGASESTSARVQLLWTPTEDLDLLLKYSTSNGSEDIVFTHSGALAGGADFAGYISPSDPFDAERNTVPSSKQRSETFSSKLTYRFGGGYELTNIAAYLRADTTLYEDGDAGPFLNEVDSLKARPRQFSEEIRLTSPANQRLSWIAGAYYLHEVLDGYFFVWGPGTDGTIFPTFRQKTENVSGFGSLKFSFTDALSASAGARVTNERKSSVGSGALYTADSVDLLNPALLTDKIPYADNLRDSLNNGVVTWDGNVKYQFTPTTMAYAKVAKGFRAGTINDFHFSANDVYHTKPEILVSYELGLKAEAFDRRLQLDLAAFYYDYKNKQVFQNIGSTQVLADAKASSRGVEVGVIAQPLAPWRVGVDGAYVDAKYDDFPNAPVSTLVNVSGVTDLSGRPLAKAPKTTVHLFTTYELALGGPASLTLRTDWNYTSRFFIRDEASNLGSYTPSPGVSLEQLADAYFQKAYWTGEFSATLNYGSHTRVTAYARNLTNEKYKTTGFVLDFLGTFANSYGAPRTYGAAIEYTF